MDLSLRGYVTAVLRGQPPADVPALVEQLDGLLQVVATNPALSAALSDVTVPVSSRRAVVQDLFASRLAEPALRCVLHAVSVERAPELLSGLHDLVELARLQAERPEEAASADDHPYGHSALRRLLAGMTAAELEPVTEVGELEEVEDELFRLARTVTGAPALRGALSDWSVPADRRAQLVSGLIEAKARPVTVRLAAAAARLRTRDIGAVLAWLAELVAEARGWRVATVRAAMEVDDDERRQLGDAMARLAGRPVEVRVTIDPSLLGGAQVAIGDLLVDATTRHRLDQLQEQLHHHEGALRSMLGDAAGTSHRSHPEDPKD